MNTGIIIYQVSDYGYYTCQAEDLFLSFSFSFLSEFSCSFSLPLVFIYCSFFSITDANSRELETLSEDSSTT